MEAKHCQRQPSHLSGSTVGSRSSSSSSSPPPGGGGYKGGVEGGGGWGGGKDQRVLLWEASVLVSFIAEAQFNTRKPDGIQRESSPVTSVLVFRLPFLLRDVFASRFTRHAVVGKSCPTPLNEF